MNPITQNGGPRSRALRNIKRQIAGVQKATTNTPPAGGTDDDDIEPKIAPLDHPGQVRVYSYYAPSLRAGEHEIRVEHPIFAPHRLDGDDHADKYLHLTSTQNFEVVGDRFSLPPNAIHTTYPPQGHGDTSDVLPHIVFNDAHFPWSRGVSKDDDPAPPQPPVTNPPVVNPPVVNPPVANPPVVSTQGGTTTSGSTPIVPGSTTDTKFKKPRNSIPWMALLVFTEDELKLLPEQLAALGKGQTLPTGVTALDQSHSVLDVTMMASNVFNIPTVPGFVTPVQDDPKDPADVNQVVKMIFPTGDLFTALFCGYDSNGYRILPDLDQPLDLKKKTQGQPDLTRYKFLAHSRQVNRSKMAQTPNLTPAADQGFGEDEGMYSIILSHRTGPLAAPKRSITTPKSKTVPETLGGDVVLPKSGIVHLVSLEGIEDNILLPFVDPTNTRVGLVSLYSWTYNILPPLSANFLDAMRTIAAQIPGSCQFRASDAAVNGMVGKWEVTGKEKGQKIAHRLRDRILDGYSLMRYIPKTGEQTVAFCRGALAPTLPKHPPTDFWPYQSNFSSKLQTIDSHLGITDITYSTAWELGRTLAISDRAYTAALNRLRHSVVTHATNATKDDMTGGGSSKAAVIANLSQGVQLMKDIPTQLANGSRVPGPAQRFQGSARPYQVVPPTSVRSSPDTRALFQEHAHNAARRFASAKSTGSSSDTTLHYNEVNVPASPDWATVLSWIINKMHLYNIPAHYLITDPANLPRESIRFFYIDPNWIDAFIDGALGVGNHLEQEDDVARQAFKFQINHYLSNNLDDKHPYKPQIPIYGFLLRSSVVEAYPNLEVHAPRVPDPNAPWLDTSGDPRLEVQRLDLLDKDILFCLFDRRPGFPNFESIVIAQAPHQQRYTVAAEFGPPKSDDPKVVNPNQLEFQFVKMYTSSELPAANAWGSLDTRTWVEGKLGDTSKKALTVANPPSIFDWDSNTLILPAFAEACRNTLSQEMNGKYVDDEPSSALVGIELADHIHYFRVAIPDPGKNATAETRRIHMPPDPTPGSPVSSPAADPTTEPIVPAPTPTPTPTPKSTPFQPNPQPNIPAPHTTAPVNPNPASNSTVTGSSGSAAGTTSNSFTGQFQSIAFQLGKAKASDKRFAISKTRGGNSPIDIVFGFIPVKPIKTGFQLHVIDIQIPLGTKPTDLAETHDIFFGGGAKMLANQRFNPHLSITSQTLKDGTTQNWLVVSLVPRVVTQLVPLERNPDVSFLLNEVTLNSVPGPVRIFTFERYAKLVNGDWVDTGTGNGFIDVVKV